jgi:hypothetical protein
MRLDRKDFTAAALAILVVGVFLTTYEGWGVPLIGDSHRWATVAILLLAGLAGLVEAPGSESPANLLAGLVVAGFLVAVIALATGSLAALALLVAAILALVAVDAGRHLRRDHSGTAQGTSTAAP